MTEVQILVVGIVIGYGVRAWVMPYFMPDLFK